MKILIIGAGHIGKRHALNLKELKCDVSIYDTNPEVMAWVVENDFEWVESIEDDEGNYDGAVLAMPPRFHVDIFESLFRLNTAKFYLIEKPLALELPLEMERRNEKLKKIVMMAHNYLFIPQLHDFKKAFMAPLRFNNRWEYLSFDWMPEWHGVDFANNYKDRHEAKDGCMAVSMSHTIYILDYLFGMPDHEEYYKSNNPILDIKGDTTVQGIRENSGSKVMFAEDWSKRGSRVQVLQPVDQTMRNASLDFLSVNIDMPQSYKTMIRCWLEVISGARGIPELCQLSEGIRIVKAVESATFTENDYE